LSWHLLSLRANGAAEHQFKIPMPLVLVAPHAQRELGLRWRHPYNVRHSCASRWLKAGIKPAFAAQQLGQSLQMFFRIYAKWIDVDETKRQEKMMDAI
jgi:integrase